MGEREDGQARWKEQRRIRDEGMREAQRKEAIEKLLRGKTPEEAKRLLEGALAELLALEEAREAEEKAPVGEERDQALETAIAWLSKKWLKSTCPYCGSGPWEIAGPFSIPFGEGDAFLSPVFSVMCSNCGQTTFVNAIRAEAVPEPEKDDEGQ